MKEKIEEAVKKIVSDKSLLSNFRKNPASVIKELIGLEISQEQIDNVVAMVNAKVGADTVSNVLGGLFGKK